MTRLIFSLNLGDYDNTFAQLSAKQARDIAAWVCLETVPSRKSTLSSHMKAKMPRVKKTNTNSTRPMRNHTALSPQA